MSNNKPNYNDGNREYHAGNKTYENTYGEPAYYQPNYNPGYTDSFYEDYEESGTGSFLLGALVGGVIGATVALFLAPKTGKEMREDFSTQAEHLKDKGIELSTVAKDKATEFSAVAKDKATEFSKVAKDKATEFSTVAKDKATEISTVAKEKTSEMTKAIQEQSGQLVDKVKTRKAKTSVPMDDGTVSSEGEESMEYKNKDDDEADITATAAAIKDAVVGNNNQETYDNSDNVGKDKIMNQNHVSDNEGK